MTRVLAVIPARGGSKGIPQKNIRDLGGKPLLYYQTKTALDCKLIDQVIVATDSPIIAGVVDDLFGDKITIVRRPKEISQDDSRTEETLLYVLSRHPADIVVTLEPTCPLTKVAYINEGIDKVLSGQFDSTCCVVEDYGFFLEELNLLRKRPMRQHMLPRLRETGNCWVTRVSELIRSSNRLGGHVGTVRINAQDAIHVDTLDDLRVAEAFVQKDYYKERKTSNQNYEESYWNIVVDPDGKTRDRSKERDKFLAQHKNIIDYLDSLEPGNILDIGCGTGFLLSGLDSKWNKYGVEISKYAAHKAQSYGHIRGNTTSFEDDFFDVVVMCHVIEHMEDPQKELQEAWRILKPNGKLIIETPDFECGVARRFGSKFRLLYDKSHISLFGLLGLHRLLLDLMFEVERVEWPYFDTEYQTEENFKRLNDVTVMSPPFYGNVMTFYTHKK